MGRSEWWAVRFQAVRRAANPGRSLNDKEKIRKITLKRLAKEEARHRQKWLKGIEKYAKTGHVSNLKAARGHLEAATRIRKAAQAVAVDAKDWIKPQNPSPKDWLKEGYDYARRIPKGISREDIEKAYRQAQSADKDYLGSPEDWTSQAPYAGPQSPGQESATKAQGSGQESPAEAQGLPATRAILEKAAEDRPVYTHKTGPSYYSLADNARYLRHPKGDPGSDKPGP